ncbi:hypothetical protein BD410DRAFT_168295 [Rickenella mellea]|uniref:Uncharacterized protein n=1 Tax=Rickenella mellea TaxID=50990 RepID=A0A4Y7PI53_9AGAM|nr:hypothetical protein BD410DRAFT_168295 [Rickenella mellea]
MYPYLHEPYLIFVCISGEFDLNFDAPIPPAYLLGCNSIKANVRNSFVVKAGAETEYFMLLVLEPLTWSWQYTLRTLPQLFGIILFQLEIFELNEYCFSDSEPGSFSEMWKPLLSPFTNLRYLRLSFALPHRSHGRTGQHEFRAIGLPKITGTRA